ncbi:protein TIFY 11d-like [Phragmites australis]|uniref:protein TIFY 11d-like n=1 Tax=Phragmites australis TaxID=29695 RepID=UPI002D7925FC|nr:protein TIFY 11d-like [Phragmites australis]
MKRVLRSVACRPESPATVPLTIFYEGRVLVFQNFRADKAMELIQLVGSLSTSQAPEKPATAEPSADLDLPPMARKASLQRFLQKRKHRQQSG